MLFTIYLGTTCLSFSLIYGVYLKGLNKLEKNGYHFLNYKDSYLKNLLSIFLLSTVPIYNVVITFGCLLKSKELYESAESKLLSGGKIGKVGVVTVNNVLNERKLDDESAVKVGFAWSEPKSYLDMSTDQQLEAWRRQKQELIDQATSSIEGDKWWGFRGR